MPSIVISNLWVITIILPLVFAIGLARYIIRFVKHQLLVLRLRPTRYNFYIIFSVCSIVIFGNIAATTRDAVWVIFADTAFLIQYYVFLGWSRLNVTSSNPESVPTVARPIAASVLVIAAIVCIVPFILDPVRAAVFLPPSNIQDDRLRDFWFWQRGIVLYASAVGCLTVFLFETIQTLRYGAQREDGNVLEFDTWVLTLVAGLQLAMFAPDLLVQIVYHFSGSITVENIATVIYNISLYVLLLAGSILIIFDRFLSRLYTRLVPLRRVQKQLDALKPLYIEGFKKLPSPFRSDTYAQEGISPFNSLGITVRTLEEWHIQLWEIEAWNAIHAGKAPVLRNKPVAPNEEAKIWSKYVYALDEIPDIKSNVPDEAIPPVPNASNSRAAHYWMQVAREIKRLTEREKLNGRIEYAG